MQIVCCHLDPINVNMSSQFVVEDYNIWYSPSHLNPSYCKLCFVTDIPMYLDNRNVIIKKKKKNIISEFIFEDYIIRMNDVLIKIEK